MEDINTFKMLINGEWVNSSDGGCFESYNPANNKVWATFPEATVDDVDQAVRAARDAFENESWSNISPTERGDSLRRLAELLISNAEELGRIECMDTGKLFKETRWQANYLAEYYKFFAGCADKVNGDTLPIDKSEML